MPIRRKWKKGKPYESFEELLLDLQARKMVYLRDQVKHPLFISYMVTIANFYHRREIFHAIENKPTRLKTKETTAQ